MSSGLAALVEAVDRGARTAAATNAIVAPVASPENTPFDESGRAAASPAIFETRVAKRSLDDAMMATRRCRRRKENPTWGRLLSSIDGGYVRTDLVRDTPHTIGRSRSSDVAVAHRNVSGAHCSLFLRNVLTSETTSEEYAYVEDNSSNGTFVNGSKMKRGERKMLTTGDEISLLHKSISGAAELSFVFVDLRPRRCDRNDAEEKHNSGSPQHDATS
jgi:hypothetical protein